MKFNVKQKNKINTRGIATILAIFLIISLGYIGYNEYNERKLIRDKSLFLQGYQQGIVDATVKLYQETENCKQVSIVIGENEKFVIDTKCLQQ